MSKVQIQFGDYEFHTEGRAQFGRAVQYEADTQGGVPRRAITTWTIDEWFLEPGFADNQNRLDALNAALAQTEGTLTIIDENGTTIVQVTARPGRNSLPVAWNQNIAEVQVTFTSREEITAMYPPGVSFTPAGYAVAGTPAAGSYTQSGMFDGQPAYVRADGAWWLWWSEPDGRWELSPGAAGDAGQFASGTIPALGSSDIVAMGQVGAGVGTASVTAGIAPIALQNPSAWKETLKTDRFSSAVSNRKETIATITAGGKVYADPGLSETARRQWLEALATQIEAVSDAADGILAFVTDPLNPATGFSRTVRVEHLDADIHESDFLTWSLGAFYRRFPGLTYEEAEYEFSSADDLEKDEIITTLKGKVRSDTETGANVKAAAILALFTPGRLLRKQQTSAQRLSGIDGDAFTELSFSYDLRELGPDTSYKLTISDKADTKQGLIMTTYSGSVSAPDSATALAKERALGAGMYPMLISSTETTSVIAVNATQQFVEVVFSYEYARNGTWQYAEVSSEPSQETFGQWGYTVSGYAVAADLPTALALARGFMVTGLLKSNKETTHDWVKDADTMFIRVDFNYAYVVTHTTSSISYKKQVTIDYLTTRTTTTTFSGTAYAVDEGTTDGLINTLVGTPTGWQIKDERDAQYETDTTTLIFLGKSFSLSFGSPTAAGEDSILECEFTLEIQSQVNHAVLTPIPYGYPFVQTGVGYNVWKKVCSGSVTALTEGAAQEWGQALATLATAGGYAEPSNEKTMTQYYPMAFAVKSYRFTFVYQAQFA